MILKPFQLVRVFLLTYTFIDLTAQFCRLSQRIFQVVMIWVFTRRVLQYLTHHHPHLLCHVGLH